MAEARALRARLAARALTALAAAAVVVLLALSGSATRLDLVVFDLLTRSAAVPHDPRIVVVAIDRASISGLGGWPWSRRVHARMLDRLDQAGARAIALDVLLTQPALYDPEGDALLARALGRSDKVVLPVHADPIAAGGSAVELLPAPEFAASAAALGHLDRIRDIDGQVRSLYLRAGLGSPHWPAMALAMEQVARPAHFAPAEPPGQRYPAAYAGETDQWVRDFRILLPRRHPAPGYLRLSYQDVLEGRVDAAALRGRWVWIGVTAPLQPGEPRPEAGLSALEHQLQGLDTLLNDDAIVPLGTLPTVALSILLACLPLLFGLPGVRSLGQGLGLALVACVALSWALLHWGQAWFPPGAALVALGLGALAWLMRRWRGQGPARDLDPLTGLPSRQAFDQRLHHELRSATRTGQPLSLLLLSIDQFDRHGTGGAEGDATRVVEALADSLRGRARRPRDLIARLEADRFAVLLPETTPQAAAAIATTLHVDLANRLVRAGPAQAVPFTTSIGLDTYVPGEARGPAELFPCADIARTQACHSGGNRTVSHAELDPSTTLAAPDQ